MNQAPYIGSGNPNIEDDDDDLEEEFGTDQHSCASSVIIPFSQSQSQISQRNGDQHDQLDDV